jgi:hypothetical protein
MGISEQGDHRVRFCASCGKHVYNFSAITPGEAISLIRSQDGDLCAQFLRRGGGTAITSESAPGPLPTTGRFQFQLHSIMALIAGCAAALGFARLLWDESEQSTPKLALPNSKSLMPLGGKVCIPPRVTQAINKP